MNERRWWIAWIVYAIAWTIALLATFPVTARDAVVSEDVGFSMGKALHVAAYSIFVILSSRLAARRWLLLLVILHAPLTEYLQQFTDRTSQLSDVGLDWLGVGIGVLLTWRSWRPHPKGNETSSPSKR